MEMIIDIITVYVTVYIVACFVLSAFCLFVNIGQEKKQ